MDMVGGTVYREQGGSRLLPKYVRDRDKKVRERIVNGKANSCVQQCEVGLRSIVLIPAALKVSLVGRPSGGPLERDQKVVGVGQ